MKAGERDRVAALRMVADALQKDLKAGGDDEVAVLRRERKRRLEAAAAYRDGGSAERADAEEAEAREIERYLPAEISDDELGAAVDAAIEETGAVGPGRHGQGDGRRDAEGRRPGRRQARQRRGARKARLLALARRQLTLDNTVAAELAGSEDTVLRELEERLGCDLFLRGNVLTLDGDDADVSRAATMVDELVGLVERGHDLAPGTIDAVTGAIAASERPAEILEDVIWRHRAIKVAPKTVNQKRYVDSIRRHTVTFGIGPAGTGKTFLAVAMAVAALEAREISRIILTRPAVEAGERLGFLPGDIQAKVDPYLRPLFDALYDMLDPERVHHLLRPRRDRGRAAGIHAGPDRSTTPRDPRRGAEHEPRADEDVPHPARLRLEDGRHRGHHPDRPAARPALRAGRVADPLLRSTTSARGFAARTSSATGRAADRRRLRRVPERQNSD